MPMYKMIQKRHEKGDFKQISQGAIALIIVWWL